MKAPSLTKPASAAQRLRANYAFKPIAEQAFRSNQTIVPQRLNAALGISMNDLWKPAVTSTIGATVLIVAVGFALAGISHLLGAMSGSLCHSDESLLCRSAFAWITYWWLFYSLFLWPLWALFFVLLVRVFASRGRRMAIGGLVLMVAGCFLGVGNLAVLVGGHWNENLLIGLSWMFVYFSIFLAGMKLYYYRAAA